MATNIVQVYINFWNKNNLNYIKVGYYKTIKQVLKKENTVIERILNLETIEGRKISRLKKMI